MKVWQSFPNIISHNISLTFCSKLSIDISSSYKYLLNISRAVEASERSSWINHWSNLLFLNSISTERNHVHVIDSLFGFLISGSTDQIYLRAFGIKCNFSHKKVLDIKNMSPSLTGDKLEQLHRLKLETSLVLMLCELWHFSNHDIIILFLLLHLLIHVNNFINNLGDLNLLCSLLLVPFLLLLLVFFLLLGPGIKLGLVDSHFLLILLIAHLNEKLELLLLVFSQTSWTVWKLKWSWSLGFY